MPYTKKQLEQYLNKPIKIDYRFNDSNISITGIIKEIHYKVTVRKLDSNTRIRIKYSQIDNIELLEKIENNY